LVNQIKGSINSWAISSLIVSRARPLLHNGSSFDLFLALPQGCVWEQPVAGDISDVDLDVAMDFGIWGGQEFRWASLFWQRWSALWLMRLNVSEGQVAATKRAFLPKAAGATAVASRP
jgi:hypothetical protein